MVWPQPRALWRCFWIAPVGVILPLIVLLLFALAPQMPDMLAGLHEVHGRFWGAGAKLGGGVFVLGLFGWYWNRAVLALETSGHSYAARAALERTDTPGRQRRSTGSPARRSPWPRWWQRGRAWPLADLG